MKKYFTLFFATLLGGLLLVGVFNLLVDPFDVFQVFSQPGFNTKKYLRPGRQTKALAVTFTPYTAFIMGSSRALSGLSARHPGWGARRAYNFALPHTSLFEMEGAFHYLLQHRKPELLVVGLDLLLFTENLQAISDFGKSSLSGGGEREPARHGLVLSYAATKKSMETLWKNLSGIPGAIDRGQINNKPSFLVFLSKEGQRKAFSSSLNGDMYSHEVYGAFAYSAERLSALGRIIAECRERGIDLRLFISPAHAFQLEGIRAVGLWEVFEQWKRDLVALVHAPGLPPVPLYDFSGFEGLVAEPIPPAGDKSTVMHWYWESSHYTEETGNLVLNRVLGHQEPGREIPQGFGVPLTPTNIEAHLAIIRSQRQQWARKFPQDVEEVARVEAETRANRTTIQKKFPGFPWGTRKQLPDASFPFLPHLK